MPAALEQSVLVIHASATLAMAGLIWFVQIVHYPLMRLVGASQFAAYQRRHMRLTGAVVGPLMLAEAATAVVLPALVPAGAPVALAWSGLALLASVWLSTWLVQVPCHRRLASGFDGATHARLVTSNWTRTAAWSARAVIALALL